MHLLPQPSSSFSTNPPNCTILCSSVLESIPIVNVDQVSTVLVLHNQPAVIHNEYDWELEHQPAAKDDLLLSAPPTLFLDIFGDSTISYFPCVNPYTYAPIVDHSQNTLNVSPSFDNKEEKFFIENPLDSSSSFSINAEGEHS